MFPVSFVLLIEYQIGNNHTCPKRKKERNNQDRVAKETRFSSSQQFAELKRKKKSNDRLLEKKRIDLCRNESCCPGRVNRPSVTRRLPAFRGFEMQSSRGKRGRAGNVILSDPKSCRRLIFDSHLLPRREKLPPRISYFASSPFPFPILAY